MNRDEFWKLIDRSRRGTSDCDGQCDKLAELLAGLEAEAIAEFDQQFSDVFLEAYRWDLWAVATIVNGGASDDGFEYFLGWLIAQGRRYFEKALRDPTQAARRIEPGEEAECEVIFSLACDAYEEKAGEELTPAPYLVSRPEPTGQTWQEEDLAALYPRLWKKYQ